MGGLGEGERWRAELELAAHLKRAKLYAAAEAVHARAADGAPTEPRVWLEYAKSQEERGNYEGAQSVLRSGRAHCPRDEALAIRSIGVHERRGELDAARALVGGWPREPIEGAWRVLLEGALVDARAGDAEAARATFQMLLCGATGYGPVWLEACRFEQRCERHHEALRVAEAGLLHLPRYGPLWFLALRLHEAIGAPADRMLASRALVARGVRSLCKDCVWKLHFMLAQAEEQAGSLARARDEFEAAAAACAPILRWKVWVGWARAEVMHGEFDAADAMLVRASAESPPKVRVTVAIEQARLRELRGDADGARALLYERVDAAEAEADAGAAALSVADVEADAAAPDADAAPARAGGGTEEPLRAVPERAASRGPSPAPKSSSRDWRVFLEAVALESRAQRPKAALAAAQRAVELHRGTGRLWATLVQLEHSRSGVDGQRAVLERALAEVPKSGEVWCEGARLHLNPHADCFSLEAARRYLDAAIEFTPQYGDSFIEYLRLIMIAPAADADARLERLWQRCIHAEPNYGVLWSHAKTSPTYSPRQVLAHATGLLRAELDEWRHVYAAAIERAVARGESAIGASVAVAEPPALYARASADFVTGLVARNRRDRQQLGGLRFDEQCNAIYGGDVIVA